MVCYSPVSSSKSSLSCGHLFCNDCWKNYLLSKLEDSQEGLIATCQQTGCLLKVPDSIWRQHLDPESIKFYEKALNKSFTEDNRKIKWCPNPKGCEYVVETVDPVAVKDIKCVCGWEFCFNCLEEAHSPCTCLYT